MTNGPSVDNVSKVTNAVRNMTLLNLLGLVVIILFSVFNAQSLSSQSPSLTERVRTAAVGILVAVATCLVGAAFGFVFGIPRSRQEDASANLPLTVQATSTNVPTPKMKAPYLANDNLERISDWLATMIVGLGLTQLSVLPGKLKSLAEFVAPGLGDTPAATVAAAAIIVYYGVGGALLGYLWTRLYFHWALSVAERMLPLSHSP